MFAQRLKSHHELHNIKKDFTISRMDVNEYIKSIPGVSREAVIYIHIPYCRKICSFCNMMRRLGSPGDDYARLIIREIRSYGELDYIRQLTFQAVYFGGGTPTTLSSRAIQEILAALRESFRLADDAEITLESTVSELTEEKINVLHEGGVNRISVGIQTFNDRGRQLLGRNGSGKEAYQKLLLLKSLGFENVNIDIIYHYPHQTREELDEDLNKVFSLGLASFSFYSLIMHPDSALQISSPSENDTDRALFDRLYARSIDQGFAILELTKLSRHDRYRYITARHDGADTLALGAGAGGTLGDMIYMNPISLENYQNYVESGSDRKRVGVVTKNQYRTVARLIGAMQRGRIPRHEYADLLGGRGQRLTERLLAEGYATETEDGCRLTPKGIYWGNNICDTMLKNLEI
ncbi:Radical SAM domain protein [Syntrophobotulus glycolicus DSM 8271]|uniref:Heme chaperone HemW n=1 Tax=Syntrophobotulus glycolicus (strain DSM 8271 / FlGlyR) TaxID=645991 RepID=F0SX02_SYNGF|nr:radical SAM protein [Syntrophobotulus glycolicus]ADY55785.1 Radical SAM domain protein [Syntrophobotulus glycolicus DSM 8271]